MNIFCRTYRVDDYSFQKFYPAQKNISSKMILNKRESERIKTLISGMTLVDIKQMKEQNEKVSIEWLHNPVVVAMVPGKHGEPDDRKSLLEPSIDVQAYHPSWFKKPKNVRRPKMLLEEFCFNSPQHKWCLE